MKTEDECKEDQDNGNKKRQHGTGEGKDSCRCKDSHQMLYCVNIPICIRDMGNQLNDVE